MIERVRFRREYVFGAFALSGLAWSWFGMTIWIGGSFARIAAAGLSACVSWLFMYAGLKLLQAPGQRITSEAMLAVLPWNGIYLYQLPYYGYLFLPVECAASALILRRRNFFGLWKSIGLAVLVRIFSFILVKIGEELILKYRYGTWF
jgi:hypothetical protein